MHSRTYVLEETKARAAPSCLALLGTAGLRRCHPQQQQLSGWQASSALLGCAILENCLEAFHSPRLGSSSGKSLRLCCKQRRQCLRHTDTVSGGHHMPLRNRQGPAPANAHKPSAYRRWDKEPQILTPNP